MKLILVESPTKARTLTKFLGDGYRIEATMGHVRDLPKSALGVDVEHDFSPTYIVPRAKKKQVTELLSIARKADVIILASDPDREGEAIAWHMAEILADSRQSSAVRSKKKKNDVSESRKPKAEVFQRITFHEITESAITHALEKPGAIDMHLVDAQQARRIIDRLVGYKLSPLLWKKLSRKWLSAGRVQSVTVRLIVEREREIERFQKEPYFTIEAKFQRPDGKEEFQAVLFSHDGVKYEQSVKHDLFDGTYTVSTTSIRTREESEAIISDLKPPYIVTSVEKKEMRRSPPAPYTTSTLQQDAGRRLYFSAKKTMQIAQKLYEEGFITYHRTDSVNLSEKFIQESREYITHEYGASYLPHLPRVFHTKSKVAQEAHEAIRPTEVHRTMGELQQHGELHHDHTRLYDMIWKRALASQIRDAVFDSTTIIVTSANRFVFQCQGSVIRFDGFFFFFLRDAEEAIIPLVSEGDEVQLMHADSTPHETNPPPRYTEASLVKTLEEKDIGRPSTYAPIISTIIERQYVKKEEKRLIPTELGGLVTDFLVSYFKTILDLPFTAKLEDDLDAIATGDRKWQEVIREFYDPFQASLMHSMEQAETIKPSVETLDEACPECGHSLVIRTGRYGKFVACSNFPTCKYTRQYGEKIGMQCPTCGNQIVIKRSKRGKVFYGCSNYPTCTFAAWRKEDIK